MQVAGRALAFSHLILGILGWLVSSTRYLNVVIVCEMSFFHILWLEERDTTRDIDSSKAAKLAAIRVKL